MQIFAILRKHIKMILGTTFVVTLAVAFVTLFVMAPKYESTTQLLVNRKLSSDMQAAQLQQTQADVQMINTYKDIITSPTVLKSVDKQVNNYPGYPGSMVALKDEISVNSQQNSQVFSVTVKSTDPYTSAEVANLTAKTFKKKVGKIMRIDNVSIVSPASINKSPVSPKNTLNLLAGVVVGLLLGIGFAFIREITDTTVTSEDFITNQLGLTSLGIVNEIDQAEVKKRIFNKQEIYDSDNSDLTSSTSQRRV